MLSRFSMRAIYTSRGISIRHTSASVVMLSTKVRVKQGTVIGGEQALPDGGAYCYFKGIPYAVPPLGELRFQAPVPLTSFESPEIDCTKDGDPSFQKDPQSGLLVGSEDCLFLNVYAPKDTSKKPLPVMVFIHGGGYLMGSSNSDFFTPLYLMQEGVIVVTLNYRLGAFGFLSWPEMGIPGNAGLKDQRLALKWVTENIAQFNGDPGNVTLFGESAGASCVHMHVLSESSKPYFHKAIMQSGTSNMPWSLQEDPVVKVKKFAQLLGCTSQDPAEMLKHLQNHPNLVEFLINGQKILSPDELRRGLPLAFKPIVEANGPEALLTKFPLESMNEANTLDIPVMMGYNSAEGLMSSANAIKKLKLIEGDLGRFIPRNLNLHPDDPRSLDLANQIRDFYFQGRKVDDKTLNELTNIIGDFHFLIDLYIAVELHSRKQHKSPLYFYRFDYIGELCLFKKFLGLEKLEGACHSDELYYLFQAAMAPEPWADQDKKIVQLICKLWGNFAKYGNPTPKEAGSFADCTWDPTPKIGAGEEFNLKTFIIDEKQKMVENPDIERIEFWREVYRKYNGSKIRARL